MITCFNYAREMLPNNCVSALGCEMHLLPLSTSDQHPGLEKSLLFLINFTPFTDYDLSKLSELRQHFPSIPHIITSSEYNGQLAVWALRNGIWDYILLPDEMNYLLDQIQYWHEHDHGRSSGNYNHQFPSMRRNPVGLSSSSMNPSKRITQAIDLIQARYNESISLVEIAKATSLSVPTLCRLFKREQGITVANYIKACRLAKAKDLLQKGTVSIQRIAYAVGYNDVSYFHRVFKQNEGMTPLEFRRTSHDR